ncbi:MAG: glycerol-3-phosphate acyltransferase [Chloroflexota bacterium]
MSQLLPGAALLLASYLLGAVPFGLIIVRLVSGKDLRQVESGRTGGTNAMRAAGFWAGLATALMDIAKGACSAWAAQRLLPGLPWLHVLAPAAAILGHNYSVFLAERDPQGRLRLRGGAGGATAVGGAAGLWLPSLLFTIPVGVAFLFGVGYASLATMSAPVTSIVLFAYRAYHGLAPWQYVFYGVISEALLVWALRPNIQRLIQGRERLVGWRAKKQA